MGNTQINDWLMEVLSGAQSGDPQAMIIAGLSGALALILVLMILIAIMGRKDKTATTLGQPEKDVASHRAEPEMALQAEAGDTSVDLNIPAETEARSFCSINFCS